MNFIKCMLVLLTSFLTLIGVTLLGLVTYVKVTYVHLETISGSQIIDIVVIIISVLLCLVSFLGCFGTATGHPKLLKAFIFFVLLMLAIKIVIVVVIYTQQDDLKYLLKKLWNKTTDRSRIEFQKVFKCCDIEGNNGTAHMSQIDPSCYSSAMSKHSGCIKVLAAVWNENLILIAGLTGAVVFNEIIIVVIASILICDGGEPNEFSKGRRVAPVTINVESAENDHEPGTVPLSAFERRNWAKHSQRTNKN